MLLIAVTGPVGAGKTTLLVQLAGWYTGRGKSVDGFVSLALGRVAGSRGAARYDLHWVATGETHVFALRDGGLHPPYHFRKEALDATHLWATNLRHRSPPSLVVLDEFGPLEASGGGHLAGWEHILSAKPETVVIAVRAGLVPAIEDRLGVKFDNIIDASATDALEQARRACLEHEDWIRIGVYGGGAGGVEATVGSALHGTQIPLRGLFLSTLQSVVMMYAADGLGKRRRVVWVPFIAAGLKALSPSGNRLRPMLAITVQGLLFSTAISSIGWNVIGVAVAGWLVGAWAGAQGIVLQYLFIGDDLLRAYDTVVRWLAEKIGTGIPGILTVVGVWVTVWGAVSAAATLYAWRRRTRMPARLKAILDKGTTGIRFAEATPRWNEAILRGAGDLARPVFWAPVAVVALLILASGSTWENVFWLVARATTVGLVVFSLARTLRPTKLVSWLEHRGYRGPALAVRRALPGTGGPGPAKPPSPEEP